MLHKLLIFIFILVFIPISLFSQVNNTDKGAAIIYTKGAPTGSVRIKYDSEWAIDVNTSKVYRYDRTNSVWLLAGSNIGYLNSTSAPTGAPKYSGPEFIINNDKELYWYYAGSWQCLNCGIIPYTAGTGINITGNTITNTLPDQTVVLSNGTGISVTGTYPNFTITNTAPDQTVTITGAGISNVTGTYPNFTITSTEIDGSITNEIQAIDSLILSGDTLIVSLGSDGVPASRVILSGLTASSGGGIYGQSDTVTYNHLAVIDSGLTFSTTEDTGYFNIITAPGVYGSTAYFHPDSIRLRHYDIGGSNELILHDDGVLIKTNSPDRLIIQGNDTRYFADYRATYSARSLIDKQYGDDFYLQNVDTFRVSNDTLYISLARDSVPQSFVVLPSSGSSGIDLYELDIITPLPGVDVEGSMVLKTVDINGSKFLYISNGTDWVDAGLFLDTLNVATIHLGNDQVTYAKIQEVTAERLLGNPAGSTANPSEIPLGTGLGFSAGSLINTSPDQTVVLNSGTGISVTGTYPTFTITNSSPNITTDLTFTGASSPYTLNSSDGTDVTFAQGSGITLSRSSNELTIAAVDQSTTNEIQRLDTFEIVSNTLRASLLNDGVPFSSVNLAPYLDNTDNQTLSVDSTDIGGVTERFEISISGGNTIYIDVPQVGGTGGGQNNVGTNLGSGIGVYAGKTDTTLNFKSLVEGYGIDITATSTEITIKADTAQIATLHDVAVVQADINAHELADGDLDDENELQDIVLDSAIVGGLERFELSLSPAGNTVYFDIPQNTDDQTLTIDSSATTDGQNFTLDIEDGNSVSWFVPSIGQTIYNASASLISDRTVSLDGYTLNFEHIDGARSSTIYQDSTQVVHQVVTEDGQIIQSLTNYQEGINATKQYVVDIDHPGTSAEVQLVAGYDNGDVEILFTLTQGVSNSSLTLDTVGIKINTIGGTGTNGQILHSDGTYTYWDDAPSGVTDLTFTGASSPYTLNSSTGTDVTFAAGTGISLSRVSNELTITNTVTDTDDQTLSLDSAIVGSLERFELSIDNGNTVYFDVPQNTDAQNLTIEGSGPTYDIAISSGTDVTIQGGGIITLSESPANTLIITGTEVDGSTTNEIQQIDTFSINAAIISASLSLDGVPAKTLDITESVQDLVGGMVTGNTETGITVTYEDSDGTLDFVAADVSATNEIQRLDTFEIVSNVLRASLLNDGVPFSSVNLAPYLDNTDAQTLSIDSAIVGSVERFAVSISGGNTIYFDVDASDSDAQTLSWNGTTEELTISGGNTVDLGLDAKYLPLTADNITANQIAYGTGTGITSSFTAMVNTAINASLIDKTYKIRVTGENGSTYSGFGADSIASSQIAFAASNVEDSSTPWYGSWIRKDDGTGDVVSAIQHVNPSSVADAIMWIITPVSGGDPIVQYTAGSANVVSGIDNSDSDIWKIDYASSLDASYAIGVNSTNLVGIGGAPVTGKALAITGELQISDLNATTTATVVLGADGSGNVESLGLSTGLSVSSGTLTVADQSATNELQTIANTSDATSHTVTLSNSGGSVQLIEGTGITLTTGGTSSAGTVTIASTISAYTDEQAQDAVGTILVDGTTIDFTYNDGTPSITAEVIDFSLVNDKLDDGVGGIYKGSGNIAVGAVATVQSDFEIEYFGGAPALLIDGSFETTQILSIGTDINLLSASIIHSAATSHQFRHGTDTEFAIEDSIVTIGGNASTTRLRFLERTGSGSNYTSIRAGTQSANYDYIWPVDNPSNGQVMTWNTGGQLSWEDAGGTDINIYDDDGNVQDGGTIVDVSGNDPIILALDNAGGEINRVLRMTADYAADDALTYFLVAATGSDSIQLLSFDDGMYLQWEGITGTGNGLTFSSNTILNLDADSILITTVPSKTVLHYITGQYNNTYTKIEGTADGQLLLWDETNGYWEIGTASGDGNGIYDGSGTVPDNTVATLTSNGDFTIDYNGGADGFRIRDDLGAAFMNDKTLSANVGVNSVQASMSFNSNTFLLNSAFGDINVPLRFQSGYLALDASLTPAQITADQNNYAPTGINTTNVLRISTDASRSITGLVNAGAHTSGRVLTIVNIGSNDIVLTNEDAASTAANRFLLGANHTLEANQSITVIYDDATDRWRPIHSLGGGGAADGNGIYGGDGTLQAGTTNAVLPANAELRVDYDGGNPGISINDAFNQAYISGQDGTYSVYADNSNAGLVNGGGSWLTGSTYSLVGTASVANTNTVNDRLIIQTNSSGTAAASFGGGILFQGESSTTDNRDMVRLSAIWTTATDASRASALVYSDVTSGGALTERFRFTPSAMTTSTNYTIGNSSSITTVGGGSGQAILGGSTGVATLTSSGSTGITIQSTQNTGSSTANVTFGNGVSFTQTSGTRNYIEYDWDFAPTSGTATHNQLAFTGTFNQTGGASGITRGIYLNQTLTAVADFRAIEIAANEADAKGIYQTGANTTNNFVGNTSFGTTTAPNASALIDMVSTSKGFGTPVMTTAQRDAISSPREGLVVYSSDNDALNLRDGASVWKRLPTTQTILKTADETVNNSSTYQADDALTFTAKANKKYVGKIKLFITAANWDVTAGFKGKITASGATTVRYGGNGGLVYAGSQVTYGYSSDDSVDIIINDAGFYNGDYVVLDLYFYINPGAGDRTVQFEWAQYGAHTSDLKVLEGSFLEYEEIN